MSGEGETPGRLGITEQALARYGAVAAFAGTVLLLVSTLLHPLGADPNDAAAAFTEYAASRHWIWIHLGQFGGAAVLGIALVLFAGTLDPGRAAAWGRIGLAGAVASIGGAAVLQAVDGVALKVMVDRWAAAAAEARAPAYEAAFAVRQIEIGLGSLLSVLFGFTLAAIGIAIAYSTRYPAWLGWLGIAGGLGMAAAGAAQAHAGFSPLPMTLNMLSSAVVLLWFILAGVLMWRAANRNL